MRIDRIIEVLLGVFLLVTAGMKALDVEAFAIVIRSYGIVEAPGALLASALFTIGAEAALGALLIVGLWVRGLVYAGTAAMLLGYSFMVGYAWIVHGITDCGCFGDYVQIGPAATIAKNLATIGILGVALWDRRRRAAREFVPPSSPRARKIAIALAASGLIFVGGAFAVGEKPNLDIPEVEADRPFASFQVNDLGQQLDLGQGEYVVALLSATCDHCRASAEVLNTAVFIPELPTVVSLMIGTPEEIDDFRLFTQAEFPIQRVDSMAFISVLTTQAPPQIHLIRDGASVGEVRSQDPTLDEVLALVDESATPALQELPGA